MAITVDYCESKSYLFAVLCIVLAFDKNKRHLLFWWSEFPVRDSMFPVCFLHEQELSSLCSLPSWVAAQQGAPETPFPPAPLGESQGIPRPAERSSLYCISQVCPRGSSRMDMPKTPPRGGVQELSRTDATTPLTTLNVEYENVPLSGLSFSPYSQDWAHTSRSCPFHLYPKVMTIAHQIEMCSFVLCKQTPETIFPAAQIETINILANSPCCHILPCVQGPLSRPGQVKPRTSLHNDWGSHPSVAIKCSPFYPPVWTVASTSTWGWQPGCLYKLNQSERDGNNPGFCVS